MFPWGQNLALNKGARLGHPTATLLERIFGISGPSVDRTMATEAGYFSAIYTGLWFDARVYP
jgi:hypothetical protein